MRIFSPRAQKCRRNKVTCFLIAICKKETLTAGTSNSSVLGKKFSELIGVCVSYKDFGLLGQIW